MTAMERFYRHLVIIEDLAATERKISKTADALYQIHEERELEYLNRTIDSLRVAIRTLKEAQTEARRQCQQALLENELAASLELIHTSPERLRAQENGETL